MYGCFDAGHGRLYQGASTGQSQPCGPSPRGSELAASELVSGGCVNLGEMGKRRLHRHTCPMGTRRRENGGRGREWIKRRGTGRMGEAEGLRWLLLAFYHEAMLCVFGFCEVPRVMG